MRVMYAGGPIWKLRVLTTERLVEFMLGGVDVESSRQER